MAMQGLLTSSIEVTPHSIEHLPRLHHCLLICSLTCRQASSSAVLLLCCCCLSGIHLLIVMLLDVALLATCQFLMC
jgi:hypothetical protein